MLFEWFRVFKYFSASMSDVSLHNQDEDEHIHISDMTTSDYFYIGQYYAFNNLFFYIDTPNNNVGNVLIEYWDGKQWRSAVDIIDGTKDGTNKTMSKSGVVQWSLDSKYGQANIADTSDNNAPVELRNITVYDLYWIRIKFSATTSNGAKLKEISYAFTSTNQLNNLDFEISQFYESFASGKTDWIPEILTASKLIVTDLRAKGFVEDRGQLLRFSDVFMPCNWKTLELIYQNLGKAYEDKRVNAIKMYEASFPQRMTIDVNGDGKVSRSEVNNSIRLAVR